MKTMKKLLSFLLAAAMLFSLLPTALAEGAALTVSVDSSAAPGDTLTLTVSIPDGTNAVGGSFDLVYDPAAVELSTATAGTILKNCSVNLNPSYAEGRARLTFDGESVLNGGIALTAVFRVRQDAAGTTAFTAEKCKLMDANYSAIDVAETASAATYILNDAKTSVSLSCTPSANSGGSVEVSVEIASPMNVCGGSFNLVYDAEKLTLTAASAGAALTGASRQINKSFAENKARVTWAGTSAISEGTLATFTFTVKQGVAGTAEFTPDSVLLCNQTGGAVGCTVGDAVQTAITCDHSQMEWKVTTPATCTETGVESYACGCGYSTESREIPALGHAMDWVVTKEATCTETGIKTYQCTRCGGNADGTEEIPLREHTYQAVVTAPTATEAGYTTYTCSVCGHSYQSDSTEALGYTVTYNANGGESAPASQGKSAGESVTLSSDTPTRAGFTFLGWATETNAQTATYTPGSAYTKDADLTLYAVWSANAHTVTYTVDGEAYTVQTYAYGEKITAAEAPTREGSTFSGWSEIPATMPDEDVEITGSFAIDRHTLTFDLTGGSGDFAPVEADYGATVAIPAAQPVKDNAVFVGWSLTENGKKAAYASGDTLTLRADMTLYAIWCGAWSGEVSASLTGAGTKTNPYRVASAADLAFLRDQVNAGVEQYQTACYIQTANIALNDTTDLANWATNAPANEWTPIGNSTTPFKGTFDGNGYTVSGLYVNQPESDSQGLFGCAESGLIANICMESGYVHAKNLSAAIIGNAAGTSIKNCRNKATVLGTTGIGGIVGEASGNAATQIMISGCRNTGAIEGKEDIGGICGCCSFASIGDGENSGSVLIHDIHGAGIVGNAENTVISNCKNGGGITSDRSMSEDTYTEIGGICGRLQSGTVEYCLNYGVISGQGRDNGGVCAVIGGSSAVRYCCNFGTVSFTGTTAGIVGCTIENSAVSDCLNAGAISGTRTAGITAWSQQKDGSVDRCINIGTITGTAGYTGAIACDVTAVTKSFYLDSCGAAGQGTALDYNGILTASNYSDPGTTWEESWRMGSNPYAAYPMIRGVDNLMENPVSFDLNDGRFDEYTLCAVTLPTGVNAARIHDSLIVYNSGMGSTTGTNEWGTEMSVNGDGIVIAVEDHIGNMAIPNYGMVLSGTGIMNDWLNEHVAVGDKIVVDYGNANKVSVYKKNQTLTYATGFGNYLPTPFKDGQLFAGWYDDAGNRIDSSTVLRSVGPLTLHARWTTPTETARTSYGGNTYVLFNQGTTWKSAKAYCESIGGHLVTITSAEENAAVLELIQNASGYCFIGATDESNAGTWRWITGEPWSYSNWADGEPSLYLGAEFYGEMRQNNGLWNDNSDRFFANKCFVCEFDSFTPTGATIYNGHYYQVFDTVLNWEYAKAYCESIGGHLATITGEGEQTAIKALLNNCSLIFYWLGGTDAAQEGEWTWVTGEPWQYSNWYPSEPNNSGGKEHLLLIYNTSDSPSKDGTWNDYNNGSANKIGFVCEFDEVAPSATAEVNGHRYEFYDLGLTWYKAEAFCESRGGHLVTITSAEEAATVNTLLSGYNKRAFIGATDEGSEGDWRWITGEAWNYTNWMPGEPNNGAGMTEHYGELYAATGQWIDVPNSFSKVFSTVGFICEQDEYVLAETVDLRLYLNESGKNYLQNPSFTEPLNGSYWYSRNTSVSTMSIDTTETRDGYNSLKIVNTEAGASGKDMGIQTMTQGDSASGWVGDSKSMVLSFWAKSSVNGTGIYFRWGMESAAQYRSVTLTTEWAKYTIRMDKQPGCNGYMHPYIDGVGTVWINQPQLEDGTTPTEFAAGSADYQVISGFSGATVALPDPAAREGYTFDGWYTAASGGTKVSASYVLPTGHSLLYAHWTEKPTVGLWLYRNESGKNYFYDPGFEKPLNSTYWRSRNTGAATVSVDETERLGGFNSLKVVNTAAGGLVFRTTTQYADTDGWRGDNRPMVLSFWAKSSVDGTAITFNWGLGPQSRSLKLTTRWAKYTVPMDKLPGYNANIHPYISDVGTVWINRPQLEDGTEATAFIQEPASDYTEVLAIAGETFAMPQDPVRAGYTFDGWYTAASGGTKLTAPYTAPNTWTTAYAHWTAARPAVRYDANGGVGAPETQTVDVGETLTVSDAVPTRGGYTFLGWATNPDATAAQYVAGNTFVPDGDCTLYAVWQEGETHTEGNLTWSFAGGVLTISGSGAMVDYSVSNPAPWSDCAATATKIVIADGVTSVGAYAFYRFANVTEVSLADSVKTVGEYAFSDCAKLAAINTGKLTELGAYAFRYCAALSEAELRSGVTYGAGVYANSGVDSVTVGAGVRTLPSGAFANCGALAALSLPESVTSVGNAFDGTQIGTITYAGTKEQFKTLVTDSLVFDEVFCTADGASYPYSDFVQTGVPVASVTLDQSVLGLERGRTAQLTATVLPENATDKTVLWSTNNRAAVTVDETGVVTAVAVGVAEITATSADGKASASCTVYVTLPTETTEATIVGSSVEAKNGDTFEVAISLGNNPGIASMRLRIDYNDAVMTLTGVEDAGVLGQAYHAADYSATPYTLYWDNGTATENFTANGEIVRLTFTVKPDAVTGEYPIAILYDYNNKDIINCELLPVRFAVADGNVSVQSFLYGDVDGDGSVNALDSALLSRFIGKWPGVSVDQNAADVNRDGKINALDSAILKRHLAGWPDYATLPH